MMLMYIDSDDSENSDYEAAGIGMTGEERLLLEAPTSTEKEKPQNTQDSDEEADAPVRKRVQKGMPQLKEKPLNMSSKDFIKEEQKLLEYTDKALPFLQSNSEKTDFERESDPEELTKVVESEKVQGAKPEVKKVKEKNLKEESDVIFIDSSRMLSKEDNKKVNSSRDIMTEVDFMSVNISKLSPKGSPKRE